MVFSTDSNYLLAWYEGSISLYAFNSWRPYGNNGYYANAEEIYTAQLAVTETMTAEMFRGLGAWSSNSRAFAYWDADGLKWLDLTMMRVPRLVLKHESPTIQGFGDSQSDEAIPPLLELSHSGRYIRYGALEEWTLLDVLTNSRYDDLLVNPEETHFLAVSPEESVYATAYAEDGEDGECMMFDLAGNCLMTNPQHSESCFLPMISCSHLSLRQYYQVIELYWQRENLVYLACESSTSNRCFAVALDYEDPRYPSSGQPHSYPTNGFAYDAVYGYVAWATDDYQLRLSLALNADPLDFSDVLDSPIASLEWGKPLWYQE
jgi:hypothetical protein